MSQHDTLEKLRDFFHAHEPFQLARIDDGRIQLHLTDEQYSVIRAALSATQPAQAAPLSPEVDEDCRQTVIWALGSAKAWTRDYAESYVTAWLTGRPAQAAQSDAVHVCPSKDIVCGDKPANWCATRPKRTAQAAQSEPPSGAFLSWAGFNLQGDEKSIKEATRLLHEAGKVPVLMQRVRDMQTAPVVLEWPALPELPVHARLYYTGSPLRRYKRASVHSGPGEPMVIVSTALEFMKRRDAQIRALLAGQPQQAAQGAGEVVDDEIVADMWSLYAGTNSVMRLDRDQFANLVRVLVNMIQATPAPAQPAPVVPEGWRPVQTTVTEEMHAAAVKVLLRATGLNGLPQRILDALLSATPTPPAQQSEAVPSEQSGWCVYVAGMVAGWLGMDVDDPKIPTMGAIIERRLWALKRDTPPAQAAACQPLLVRDIADMFGTNVPEVCKAFEAVGFGPRSTNMAVTPDEAVAVAKHLTPAQAAADARDASYYRMLRDMPEEAPSKGLEVTIWDGEGSGDAIRGCALDSACAAAISTHQQGGE